MTLAAGLLFMVRDTTRVLNWTSSGFTLCSIQQARDSTVTFFGVHKEDFTGPPYPVRGDTILMIGDSTALERRWVNALERPHVPGREVAVTFRHKGEVERSVIRTRANAPILVGTVVVLQILRILIFLAFLVLGFWAYFQRTESAGVRALALYCFAMATFTVTVFLPMYAAMASFQIPGESWFLSALRTVGIFFGAYWFLLQLLFPRSAPLLTARPWSLYGVIFVPLALVTAFSWLLATALRSAQIDWVRYVFYFITASQALAGLYVLRRNYRRAESNVEKRQTRLVMFGSGVPLLVFCIYLLDYFRIIPALSRMPLVARMSIMDVIFATVLLSPVSLAYAFGKYRLLEIEGKLRRGTRRIIALTLLIGAVLGVAWLGNELIHEHFASGNPLAVVVLSVVVIGMFRLAEMGKRVLEKHLYPERQRLRDMLHDFLQHTATIVDRRLFWNELEVRLKEGLAVDGVFPILRAPESGSFLLREKGLTPFHDDSKLVLQLKSEPRPLMVDEAQFAERVALEWGESRWLTEHGIALVLPLVTHGNLVGFLGLGHKTEQEDYAAEELRILDSLAPQVALATDNMRLIEDNIEKRRMEEELRMARHVQQGLLPKELPVIPGLEIASHSNFSLEVAGDYYDIIPLERECTMLAVGDVSGKGAGAALLMANLQASLRALAGADIPLTHLMGRINTLIHRNTEPEQFITFFAGLYDSGDHTLHYVNAGHNPPFVIRANGRVEYLRTGGLILGAFPDAQYELGTVHLKVDDVLVLYTDGISEAMNAIEEEFGEDRLIAAACACNTASAEYILAEIIGQTTLHQGASLVEDDQTLLVAKVL